MESTTRSFSAGSRQAPDPYDQYLEREGFYRKHTARDSTCLFRVVSEQVFDVQLYHDKVRADCINFMRKRRDLFEKKINYNYNQYLNEMCKIRSYGSLIELNAIAHVYRRNVLLFEPYNCGSWLVKCESYKDSLMVFFSPDRHFDSIFTTPYITQAAYCQALVYEILYVKVFKLPDVMYSVERMLHNPDDRNMTIIERKGKNGNNIEKAIVAPEGREFVLDTAGSTKCVLDNYRLCHFHNRENFAHIVDIHRNKRSSKLVKEIQHISGNCGRESISRDLLLVNPMLCEKKMSCVRQLLKEGITPFPYKVAKALDPNIYRNIEFDSWSDLRRELKKRSWYLGVNCLQVGARCLVNLNDDKSQLLHGYIQEMQHNNGPCVVYLEELAECRTVPYDNLRMIATEPTKSWNLPCKSRNVSEYHHSTVTNTEAANCKLHSKLFDLNLSLGDELDGGIKMKSCASENTFCCFFNNSKGIKDGRNPEIEMAVMPLSKGNNNTQRSINKNNDKRNTQKGAGNKKFSSHGAYNTFPVSSGACNNQLYCYSYVDSIPYYPFASNCSAQPYRYGYAVPGAYHCPYYGPMKQVIHGKLNPNITRLPIIQHCDGVPNFNATLCVDPTCSDLPVNDCVTLRYFYNLGIDYFRQNQFRMKPPAVPLGLKIGNTVDSKECSIQASDGDFENKFSISSISSIDNNADSKNPKKWRTPGSVIKNEKYASKQNHIFTTNPYKQRPEQKNLRSQTTQAYPARDCNKAVRIPTLHTEMNFVQAYNLPPYPSNNTCPAGVPFYIIDSINIGPSMTTQGAYYVPTYSVHPFVTVATSPDFTIHESVPTCPTDNIFDSYVPYDINYSPTTQGAPQLLQGYTVWKYQPTPPSYHTQHVGNNEDINNGTGDPTQWIM